MIKSFIQYVLGCTLAVALIASSGVYTAAQSASPEDTYLLSVQEQTSAYDESIEIFDGYMVRLFDNPTDSEAYMLVEAMALEVEVWRDIVEATGGIDVPASCEDSGAALQTWADEADLLADGWDDLYDGRRGAEEAFETQQGKVDSARAALDSALTACYQLSTLEQPETVSTPVAESEDEETTDINSLRDIVRVKPGNDSETGNASSGTEEATEVADEVGEYTMPSSGMKIEFEPSLLLEDPSESTVPDQMLINSGSGLSAVGVLENDGSAREAMKAYVDGFASQQDDVTPIVLDGNHLMSTGVYRVVISGVDYLMFVRADSTTMPGFQVIEVIISEPGLFLEEMELLQTGVTIDGIPMFEGVDASSVLDVYEQSFP